MKKRMNVISTPSRGRGAILIVSAALLGACSADHTLGGVTGAGGNGADGGVVWNPLPDAGPGPEVGPLGPTQSWTGYVELQKFPSGSDALKLTVATDSAGNAVGTFVIGQGTPPPPATDPDVGYPPSFDVRNPATSILSIFVAEGYPYAFTGTLENNRLRFTAHLGMLWKDWCALQTPYPPGWCGPPQGTRQDLANNKCDYEGPQNHWTPIDCAKAVLCGIGSPCECAATGCRASSSSTAYVTFDMLISGNAASGSAVGNVNGNVHFTKDP